MLWHTLDVDTPLPHSNLSVESLRNVDLSEYLREWLAAGPKTKGNLKLEVDVDPQSFL